MNTRSFCAHGLVACALLICAVLFVPAAQAEEELAPGFNACTDKATSTADNLECLTAAYNHWDKVLNANFKKAQGACAEAMDAKQCRAALLKAQRLWIQYKEAMTDAIMTMGGGGSIDRLGANDFVARETRKQAQLLGE